VHGIFINYRREDVTGFARSIFDRLRAHFGESQVFMDVSNIEPGLDFIDALDKSLKSCEALLVLIGPDWESICVERSGEPDDFVRIEVAAALKRNVRVIPVLVQGATMPDEANLPEDIKPLVRRQATALSNDRFDSDIERLIEVLEKTLGGKFKAKPEPITMDQAVSSKKTWLSGRSGILAGFVLAFVLLVVIGVWVDEEDTDPAFPDEVDTFLETAGPDVDVDVDVDVDEPWSVEEKAQVQLILQNLGYQPGTIDGVIGENTTVAIRRFQRDVGLPANGLINEELLDALIVAEPLNQQMPTTLNLTGTWYDNFGNRVVIQQRGNEVNAVSYNSYSGLQMSVSRGTVYGNQLNYQWDASGTTGMGVGTMNPDLRHMDIVVTDSNSGLVETNQLHKEHLPGQ
jgi:TIR domain-containing protein/putative peptidoglycan binding protein